MDNGKESDLVIKTVNASFMNETMRFFDIVEYNNEEFLIYKGHVPKVGFILKEGVMKALDSKTEKTLSQYSIIGVKELLGNSPLGYSLKTYPGTKVYVVDKSTIIKIKKLEIKHIEYFFE
jgi:hypothetical protein